MNKDIIRKKVETTPEINIKLIENDYKQTVISVAFVDAKGKEMSMAGIIEKNITGLSLIDLAKGLDNISSWAVEIAKEKENKK